MRKSKCRNIKELRKSPVGDFLLYTYAMHPVYLFIGQSGAGKGTQIALLKEALLKQDPATKFFVVETGDKFREFITSTTYTAGLTRELMDHGSLPPAFLGVHMWAHELMEGYDGKATVFLDGTPRVAEEVPLLLSAAGLYNWTIDVVYLQTSDEWAYARIKGRGRADDATEHAIMGRIEWFHTKVEPAIELLRASPLVRFHGIQGEQTIEQVHADVLRELQIE
jgi:adenylate kinase family enzyme